MTPEEHWNQVYHTKSPLEVSWYHTDSAKFRNTRKSVGCSSIPQNPYFFLLPLVGLIPQTTRNQSESVSKD